MKHLIIGNGPAGVIAAETIRKYDSKCSIMMFGSEDEPPYSRMALPYLLEGNILEEGTYLRKNNSHFRDLDIDTITDFAAAVEPKQKTVLFQSGRSEKYDRLLIATGSKAIAPPIPGLDLPNVHNCWTMDDARAIASKASKGKRIVQIGAGFIGCILLEAFVNRGAKLTVVELGNRMVPRMMTKKAGSIIKNWVIKKGVNVLTGASVDKIEKASSDGALKVTVSNGQTLDCDLVVVSAGVTPNIGFLAGSGIKTSIGIVTNNRMETSITDIFAAGDVAQAPELNTGEQIVSAIQPNAADQGRIAALNMIGSTVDHTGVLAMNVLDTIGLVSSSFGDWEGVNADETVELCEEALSRYISLQFSKNTLVGATSVGLTQHVGALRGLIQNQVKLGGWEKQLLDDPLKIPEAYIACAQKPSALNG